MLTRPSFRALVVLSIAATSCRSERSARYTGTVIVGADYVQALVTATGDRGCPPRAQRAGTCVRTPPARNPDCAAEPVCVTSLSISAPGQPTVTSPSALAAVPWLATAMPGTLAIELRGCGGTMVIEVDPGPPMSPFAKATVRLVAGRVNLTWTPAAGASQICALSRWPAGVEVCCTGEGGAASFPAPAQAITDVRLSRGSLVKEVNGVRVYKTRETANLIELPDQ